MKKKKTAKQIAAIVCIVLLAGALISITLLSAVFAFPGWQRLFSRCLICTGCSPRSCSGFSSGFTGSLNRSTRSHPSISDRPTQAARRTRTRQMLRRTKTQKRCCTGNYFPGSSTFSAFVHTFLRFYSIFLFFSTFIVITHATKNQHADNPGTVRCIGPAASIFRKRSFRKCRKLSSGSP